MATKMKEYRYYLSSGVHSGIRIKVSHLELAPSPALIDALAVNAARTNGPKALTDGNVQVKTEATTTGAPLRAFPAPGLEQRPGSHSELRNSTVSEIFLTAQIFSDGLPLHPMVISSKGPTKCSDSTIYWNEWLAFPLTYRDLARNSQLAITVWGVGWVPLGGTTISFFTRQGVLRDGMQCLRLWRDVEADASPSTKTPFEIDEEWAKQECFRLDKLREKYERKEISRNEWMDGVTDRRIARIRRGGEPPGRKDALGPFCSYREEAVLWMEMPYFGDVVVYEEEPYAQRYHSNNMYSHDVGTTKRHNTSVTTAAMAGATSGPTLYMEAMHMTGGGGYDSGSARDVVSGSSLIVVADPDLNEENPAERKYRKLARDILRGSIDPNLKPSRDEKARIEALLATPTDILKNEDKDLLWKFRYTLTDNKKAVVKFLLSVDWNDETEVKQATDLLHQWCEIDIADALKLLGRDKEFKHDVVRNFAVSTLARAKNEDLQDFLLQLVQAMRYERSTLPSSSSRNDDTVTSMAQLTYETLGPLARFLIARSSSDPQMANYFYWYLRVEASEFGRDADIFRIVLNCLLEEMKRDPEKKPIFDMIAAQQSFMEKILALHNKAREERGRKDQKEEKFRQLLKQFAWAKGSVIRMPLDPNVHLSGIIASSAKMFKSAMYPAVIEFPTVIPQEPHPHGHPLSQSQLFRPSSDSILENPMGMSSSSVSNGADLATLRESLSTRVIHYLNRDREGPIYKVMVKNGDDLRQDQLIMQMFILMDRLLKKVNLDLKLTPYRILATGLNDGLMEFVQDSYPVSYIVEKFESPQVLSFLRKHQPDPSAEFGVSPEALSNYVKSVAGYCVVTYILGIGDRHLDNLMMKSQGHLFHIDFGFIFGADPKPLPPPFKLTKEMVEGMGGPDSEHYLKFKTYCCQAYNWLRKSADLILNLLSLMADGGIEGFANDPETTLQKVQEKFRLDLTDEQAEQFFLGLINDSVRSLFPVVVDIIHKWATKLK
ncbi:hypothetical protein Poli38472_004121 [Pythium oligandrum]|uniref:phosphatidylinositol 3-kinase n=1 Tax=Pythium oligandrum TaxID=41045 RepID=A0A8K1CPH6_PYTOL|nr:hypothetical protein Poli38472_004121 [Pythium oligandrum]|eukprot:TMW66356.1 hypothetical protein Poli38472_004121 [Pythium oligandrum]